MSAGEANPVILTECRHTTLTLGARGFSRVRQDFSLLAEGRHIVGSIFRAGHYKDLTETENRARKVSGTQGMQRSVKTE